MKNSGTPLKTDLSKWFIGFLKLVKKFHISIPLLSKVWNQQNFVFLVVVFWKHLFTTFLSFWIFSSHIPFNPSKVTKIIKIQVFFSQCPRTDLNKRFLPRPKTISAWKLKPYRSKISKNWNPPWWVPLHRFFKNWFLLIQNQLYSNYIQTHFTW